MEHEKGWFLWNAIQEGEYHSNFLKTLLDGA